MAPPLLQGYNEYQNLLKKTRQIGSSSKSDFFGFFLKFIPLDSILLICHKLGLSHHFGADKLAVILVQVSLSYVFIVDDDATPRVETSSANLVHSLNASYL